VTLNVCQLKICTYIFNLFFSGVPEPASQPASQKERKKERKKY
jgi:hypothetical protein